MEFQVIGTFPPLPPVSGSDDRVDRAVRPRPGRVAGARGRDRVVAAQHGCLFRGEADAHGLCLIVSLLCRNGELRINFLLRTSPLAKSESSQFLSNSIVYTLK